MSFILKTGLAAAVSLSLLTGAALAQGGPKYTASNTIGELVDKAETKAVLQKHIPQIIASDQMAQTRGMTLQALAGFPMAGIDAAKLKAITDDLAKVK